jgi:adenylate cyclase class 2
MPDKRRVETEIKLKAPSAAEARRGLQAAGFLRVHPRALESNQIYDTPDHSFRKSGKLVRLRTWGPRALLTFKGPAKPGARHKSREEIESGVSDAAEMSLILERMGLVKTYRYEKYRSEFRIPGENGLAALDETPIGVFLELEGASAWIDRTARKLGYTRGDYITASYGALYMEQTAGRGRADGMVFKSSGVPPRRRVSTFKKST